MKVLKILALSLLGLILFLALTSFGTMFMLKQTVLNPTFVTSELDRLDITAIVKESLPQTTDQTMTELVNALPQIEPLVKAKADIAIGQVYAYLLGKTKTIDLASTLRGSLLSKDLIVSVLDKVDISPLVTAILKEQIQNQVPAEFQSYVTDEVLNNAVKAVEPALKQQIVASADPILDYLVGKSQNFEVSVSLAPAINGLRSSIESEFLKSPPPALAGLPQSQLQQYFDQFFDQLTGEIPPTITIDQTILGPDFQANITQSLSDAEQRLTEARGYVSQFQTIYNILLVAIIVLVLLIVLIYREVKGATRSLGTTFLTYGALEYIGVMVGKYIFKSQIPNMMPPGSVPASLEAWIVQLIDDLLAPLEMFTLAFAIGGLVLVVVSFVYPRLNKQSAKSS